MCGNSGGHPGEAVEETLSNLREAVALHLNGEDLTELGLAPHPIIVVTMELEPALSRARGRLLRRVSKQRHTCIIEVPHDRQYLTDQR